MSLKTIFESIESDFAKLFSKAPTVLQVVETDIAVVAPVVETIIATVGSASSIKVNDSTANPFAISIDKLQALGFTPMATLDQVRRYAAYSK